MVYPARVVCREGTLVAWGFQKKYITGVAKEQTFIYSYLRTGNVQGEGAHMFAFACSFLLWPLISLTLYRHVLGGCYSSSVDSDQIRWATNNELTFS